MANSLEKSRVREKRWGWKAATMRRPGYDARAACSVANEMRKSRTNVFQITVDVQMICFDVGHDRDARRQRQERAIVFVGLDDEEIITLVAEISLPLGDASARDSRWLETGGGEHRCSHDCGRCLSVRAGDANEPATGDGTPQGFGAPCDGDSQLARALQLRMILGHRRRPDQFARVAAVAGAVPCQDPAAACRGLG